MALLDASLTKPNEGGSSFSFRHRLVRIVWNFVWFVLASWTPPPMHRWRVFLLRLFGGRVHWTAHVYGSTRVWYPPNLEMAEHACLGPRTSCYCMAPIHIGRNAVVSQDACLCAGSHDINDPNFQLIVKPIVLGAGAWVAADAFVGPGVTIGDRAVIGARGVQFKDAESDGVYIGNPARLVKRRCISRA